MRLANEGVPSRITAMTLKGALIAASHHVCGIHICPMHLRALLFLFVEDNSAHKMLLVARTDGEGESHVIWMTGTVFHGIQLIFHPLLVLTAEQITKFICALISHRAVMAHNLDKKRQASSSRAYVIA